MENQIQLQLHHFCIINYNYVIGPSSGLHLTSVYFTVEKHVCSCPYFGAYSMVNTRLIVHSMDIQATLMSPGRTKHVCCFPYIGSYVLVITRAGLRHFEMY